MVMDVRPATALDIEPLTMIWFQGWHAAHASIVPEALTRLRTLESFRDRLRAELDAVLVITTAGTAAGFAMIRNDELFQFYVAAPARGTGVAAALMTAVEADMAARGVQTAWLACAVGNARAARFYEKFGWRQARTMTIDSETSEGPFPVAIWRYEKDLAFDWRRD